MPENQHYEAPERSHIEYSGEGLIERQGTESHLLHTRDAEDRNIHYEGRSTQHIHPEPPQALSANITAGPVIGPQMPNAPNIHYEKSSNVVAFGAAEGDDIYYDAYGEPALDFEAAAVDVDMENMDGDLSAPGEGTVKPSRKGKLELEDEPQRKKGKKHQQLRRTAKEIALAAHGKVEQASDGNAGLQTGHLYERVAEKGMVKLVIPAGRKVVGEGWKIGGEINARSIQNIRSSAQAAWNRTEQNLAGGTKVQKAIYKRQQQVKQIYGRMKSAAAAAKQGASWLGAVGNKILSFFGGVKTVALAGGGLALLAVLPSVIATLMVGGVTTLLVDQKELAAAVMQITHLDATLEHYAINIETERPGFDDYETIINGTVFTEQLPLASYLNVVYEDYKLADVEAELQTIHDYLYTSEETESEENDPEWVDGYEDPVTGAWVSGYWEDNITTKLTITVTCRSISEYIATKLDLEQLEWYNVLVESGGNLSNCGNPFRGESWTSAITTNFGWRVNPVTSELEQHNALDIPYPTGTPINATTSGTATVGHSNIFGNYLIINDSKYTTMYAHCDEILVTNGSAVSFGDVVAKVGNTGQSTGPHLHIEVKENGQPLNPLFMLVTS